LQSGAATYTTRWIPSPELSESAKGHQTEPMRSEASTTTGGYSKSGFYFLPSRCAVCARASGRSHRAGRPVAAARVCRFIASRPIRDNCWPGISDVCAASRDAKPFFRARARARGSDTALFYYVRNFSPIFPRARGRARTHARTIIARSRPLERASFIAAAVNARADRRAGGTRLIGMLLSRLKY